MQVFKMVRLITNRYVNKGLKKGDIGYILEVYDENNFEVEFSDVDGTTIMLCSFPKEDLEFIEK